MYARKIFTYMLSLLFGKRLGVLALFLLMAGGCGEVMFHIDAIKTDDFESVRSSIEPDISELFNQARQEFARGDHWYELGSRSSYERYGIQNLDIVQFEGENGKVYEILFAFTGALRGFGQGYYYTPSGKLPPGAPRKGVVCSKHMDDFWYAFHTIDSQRPPDLKDCPEDTQYHQ